MIILNAITVGAALALVLLGLARRRRHRDAPATPAMTDLTPVAVAAGLLACLLARLAMLWALDRHGFIIFTIDEAIRFNIAWGWSRDPFFFSHWDGIWLVGNFAYYGLWMRLVPEPGLAALAGLAASHVLNIGAAYAAGVVIGGRRWTGLLGAWLLATAYPFLWAGNGPMAEPLLVAAFLLTLTCAWRALGEPERPRRSAWRWAAGAMAAAWLTASLHYTGWMALAVGNLFLLAGVFVARRRAAAQGGPGPSWAIALAIVAATAVFPLMWAAGSWRHLGHPLQFMHNEHQAILRDMRSLKVPLRTLSTGTVYARLLAAQFGALLPLLALGLLDRHPERPRRAWAIALGIATVSLALASLSAFLSGHGASPYRGSMITGSLFLLCIAGACRALEPLLGVGAGRLHRALTLGLLAVALAGSAAANLLIANRYESVMVEQFTHDLLALGTWLKQEVRRPETLAPMGPDTRLGFHADRFNSEWARLTAYLGGCPDRLDEIPQDAWAAGRLHDYEIIITNEGVPEGFRQLARIEGWSVCRRP